jgi:hypothetical protein
MYRNGHYRHGDWSPETEEWRAIIVECKAEIADMIPGPDMPQL